MSGVIARIVCLLVGHKWRGQLGLLGSGGGSIWLGERCERCPATRALVGPRRG